MNVWDGRLKLDLMCVIACLIPNFNGIWFYTWLLILFMQHTKILKLILGVLPPEMDLNHL